MIPIAAKTGIDNTKISDALPPAIGINSYNTIDSNPHDKA